MTTFQQATARRRIVFDTTLLAAFALTVVTQVTPRGAHASCNLIPVTQRSYPSTLGNVVSPITAPGEEVVIQVTPCDDASAGFEPLASDNSVMLTFEPPSGASTTDVPVAPESLAVANCALSSGRCTELSFVMPDTSVTLPPNGLAGPARVTVRDGSNVIVAKIGELFLPTLACDREPETVFEQFTVLPHPNNFAEATSGALIALLATVDRGGNLLVPLDYWGDGVTNSVLAETPGAPVAIFLEGTAAIPAMSAGDPQTIADKLTAEASPSDFVRSFTLDGRPLPPLLRVTTEGGLYGTADAVKSVLRIARNNGRGGPDLYNLGDRLSAGGKGPILIDSFVASVNKPVPLKSLKSSDATVAFAHEEAREGSSLNPDPDQSDLVPEVIDAETGHGVNTAKAVTEVRSGFFKAPALVTSGTLVAFLESESGQGNGDIDADGDTSDNWLRVFTSQGDDLTGPAHAALNQDVAVEPLVNGRSLAISGTKTFFRRQGTFIEAAFDNRDGVDGLAGASLLAISPDGAHVYVTGGDDNAIAVFERDAATGKLVFVLGAGRRSRGRSRPCRATRRRPRTRDPDNTEASACAGIVRSSSADRPSRPKRS